MALNIFKDYVEYDKKHLKQFIYTLTAKKINNKVCNMVVETYANLRYFNALEPVKKSLVDNVEHYVINTYLNKYVKEDKRKSLPYIIDALLLIRYIVLLESDIDKKKEKKIAQFEVALENKYENTGIMVIELIKSIKNSINKKKKFIENLAADDFSVTKKSTSVDNLYEIFLDSSVKIPDLFSDVAINRVYNSGLIYEDRMLVLYMLTVRECLIDSINGDYDNKYLIEIPISLFEKRNKLLNLLKIIENDYLRERMIIKIRYSDYKKNKQQCDKLIHEGYSLAVNIDKKVSGNLVLLNIFRYILLDEKTNKKVFAEFDNIVNI